MSSFFRSFSLRILKALTSVSDLATTEEQMLAWAETDSLHTAVSRRLYIIAKYREMLLHKFLEARHQNFESSTPTTAIYLQVLDMLSEAHHLASTKLVEQMRLHKLEWTRTLISNLFGGDDVQSADDIPPTPATDDVLPIEETTVVLTDMVYQGLFNEVRRDIQDQKAALIQNLDDIRKEGRDEKKGEDNIIRGAQPPENRSRPGDGGRGGSRSEPPRKRGSGLHRGTNSRGWRYWLG
ncbi:hypothetical protein F511_15220 [Dorcoceras hygrometricum]|uniref:Uncharacterized protein n=1 Tax=Dorcoceras hygrometricum TaxID=472368 RepID=A0A2Z7CAQ4_9LAMI|nr:hypothetical protein F511_15220 [Dorcoceras hygrometricum]